MVRKFVHNENVLFLSEIFLQGLRSSFMNSSRSNDLQSILYRRFLMGLFFAFSTLFFWACGTEAESGIITTAYGVSVESIPQKEQIDSIRVFVVISGDTASSKLYDENEIEDDLLVFNIDAPSESSVRVIYTIYIKGFGIYAGDHLFLSGESPIVPDPESVPFSNDMVDARDGQKYSIVLIGNQIWMAENLNYSGDDGAGNKTYEIGWCYGVGGSDTANHADSTTCDDYGRLYSWDIVMDDAVSSDSNPSGVQGICPAGWHVPSDAEWSELKDFVIENTAATGASDNAPYLKATSGWNSSGNGTDAFGFSALPGGYRYDNGSFDFQGGYGFWWSATEYNSDDAWYQGIGYDNGYILRSHGGDGYRLSDEVKLGGLSLRCIQN